MKIIKVVKKSDAKDYSEYGEVAANVQKIARKYGFDIEKKFFDVQAGKIAKAINAIKLKTQVAPDIVFENHPAEVNGFIKKMNKVPAKNFKVFIDPVSFESGGKVVLHVKAPYSAEEILELNNGVWM